MVLAESDEAEEAWARLSLGRGFRRRGAEGLDLCKSAGVGAGGAVEIVGYLVEIGFWVMIVLVGDGLLFNGFVLDRIEYHDEVREFMDKIGQGF